MSTVKFQTIENFIKKQVVRGVFPVDTASKLKNRQLVLRDNTEYIRAEIPASLDGEKNLVTANGLILAGKQTFKGQSLAKAHNHVITHVRVAYAGNAASGKEALLSYANDDETVPAGLKNASLIIRQNGKDIVNLPVSDFVSPAKDGSSAYVELGGFALIKEDVNFDVILEFPAGTELGADKHYVEVSLKGMATFER